MGIISMGGLSVKLFSNCFYIEFFELRNANMQPPPVAGDVFQNDMESRRAGR
jgi:hypothetical protein